MEALKDFPEDFAKALQISLYALKIFNIRYLENDQPFLKKYWRFSYIIVTMVIHSLALSFHMPEVLTGQDMTQFSQLMPCFLISVQVILKFIVLIPKTRQISAFIKELGSLWRMKLTLSQKQEKDTLLWRLNFFNRANFWAHIWGAIFYSLSPLFETLFRRLVLKQDGELLLPLVVSYPFNPTKNWTIYILVYIFQLYSVVLLDAMYMGAALMTTTSCALLGIEFLMLRAYLAEVKPEPNRERSYDLDTDDNEGPSMKSFLKRHQNLLRLSRQLDNIFNGMVFIDLLFVGIMTCALSFMLQLARGPGYMLVGYIGISTAMLTVLHLCYYAELLTGASSSIGDTAYGNLWYKGEKQYKIAILLIIKICQNPCCLTSLKYTAVFLNTFTKANMSISSATRLKVIAHLNASAPTPLPSNTALN